MNNELNKRINTTKNFSTDLVHEIRNPLASLKSASEIISETKDKEQTQKTQSTQTKTKKQETKEAKTSVTNGIFDDFHSFLEDNFGKIKAKRIDNTSDKAEAENEREEFIHQYESYLTELELNGIEFDDYSYNDWLEEKIAREVKN